ncbi:MAG TPA: tetratricopeptide repeat protein [Thermoanaerobaculia bacterium]|nr:tetratricopeptide repeat protein [Thermoanaerobaculia bacterium]
MRRPSAAFHAAAAAVLTLALAAPACAPKKPKTNAEILLTVRMAQVLLRDNRPAEAEKAFREVLKDDSKNPEVWDGLGVSLLMQQRYKESLEPLQKAVKISPQNGSYRNNLGVAQMELGDFAAAEQAFRAAEESSNADDKLSAAINWGRLRERQGRYKEAQEAFSGALARDPQSFAAILGRAAARESDGDLEGAAEDYLAALKLEPSNAEANLRLGLCLVTLKKTELGRRYLQRAVELDPSGDTGARARILLESGKPPG